MACAEACGEVSTLAKPAADAPIAHRLFGAT